MLACILSNWKTRNEISRAWSRYIAWYSIIKSSPTGSSARVILFSSFDSSESRDVTKGGMAGRESRIAFTRDCLELVYLQGNRMTKNEISRLKSMENTCINEIKSSPTRWKPRVILFSSFDSSESCDVTRRG